MRGRGWGCVRIVAFSFTWGGNLVALCVLVYAMGKGVPLPSGVVFWSLMVAFFGVALEESRAKRERMRACKEGSVLVCGAEGGGVSGAES